MTFEILTLQQGSEAWHEHRRASLNASDAPAMLGISPYKSRAELVRERATGIAPDVTPAQQRIFDRGHSIEALARLQAEAVIGEDLSPCVGTSGKFSASFDTVWASEAARVIQIPHRAPDANAFAESFIGTLKRECLDFFVCFSRSQLDYILRAWVRHYNVERPHRGRDIGNNVLQVDFRPARDGPIRRRRQLGGIITSYTRDAA